MTTTNSGTEEGAPTLTSIPYEGRDTQSGTFRNPGLSYYPSTIIFRGRGVSIDNSTVTTWVKRGHSLRLESYAEPLLEWPETYFNGTFLGWSLTF